LVGVDEVDEGVRESLGGIGVDEVDEGVKESLGGCSSVVEI
jgi:hypothetical protein